MRSMKCRCPYVICPLHGNCNACIAKNIQTHDLCYCMEETAIQRGAKMPQRMPEQVFLEDSFEDMSRKSAELIAEVVRRKPDALVSLPAGSTAKRTYEILHEMAERHEVDFTRTEFVALDEWLDLEDESENCDAFMRKNFYGPLNIPDERVKRFDIHASDLERTCRDVDAFIFAHHGIDVMLLGVGMNGHLGLNEPGEDFNDFSKVVQLSETTKSVGQKYFQHGKVLTRGITLGIHHIFNTKKVILQVTGKHKQDIMYKLYTTRPTEDLPASALDLREGAVVIADKAAAGRIIDIVNAK